MATLQDRGFGFSPVELDRAECLQLLRGSRIARVVLSVDCLPVALPVNVSVLGEEVFFSTGSGSKLATAVQGQVVSIEADDIDLDRHTGWSVMLTGIARLVSKPDEVDWANRHVWPTGPRPLLVKVPVTLISGRHLRWGALSGSAATGS